MPIVGNQLETGVRVVAERSPAGGPPWHYRGEATTRDACFRLSARLDAEGIVSVELEPDPPPGLTDKVRLMVRAAWKHAREDEVAPPRRIARWRAKG